METAIRLHRAGEGAGFTGLKPAGIDYGPMIPAAERSLETGDLQSIKSVLIEEIDHVLGERLSHIRELRKVSSEPASYSEVAALETGPSTELQCARASLPPKTRPDAITKPESVFMTVMAQVLRPRARSGTGLR